MILHIGRTTIPWTGVLLCPKLNWKLPFGLGRSVADNYGAEQACPDASDCATGAVSESTDPLCRQNHDRCIAAAGHQTGQRQRNDCQSFWPKTDPGIFMGQVNNLAHILLDDSHAKRPFANRFLKTQILACRGHPRVFGNTSSRLLETTTDRFLAQRSLLRRLFFCDAESQGRCGGD